MIMLETKKGVGYSTKFFFHTMQQCQEFIYALRNHWMNVPFEEPIEAKTFPEIEERSEKAYYLRRYLEGCKDKSGKEIAESNLGWADAFCKTASIGLNDSQKLMVSAIANHT